MFYEIFFSISSSLFYLFSMSSELNLGMFMNISTNKLA